MLGSPPFVFVCGAFAIDFGLLVKTVQYVCSRPLEKPESRSLMSRIACELLVAGRVNGRGGRAGGGRDASPRSSAGFRLLSVAARLGRENGSDRSIGFPECEGRRGESDK